MSSSGDAASGLRALFPALTRKSLFRHYIPLSGAACHTGLASHILNPTLLPRLLPKADLAVANLALLNSNVAIGYWIYHRSHMRKVGKQTRVMYAAYLGTMFNFGSILIWACTKYVLPKNTLVRCVFGSLTSLCLLAIGREYLAYIDFLATDVNEPATD